MVKYLWPCRSGRSGRCAPPVQLGRGDEVQERDQDPDPAGDGHGGVEEHDAVLGGERDEVLLDEQKEEVLSEGYSLLRRRNQVLGGHRDGEPEADYADRDRHEEPCNGTADPPEVYGGVPRWEGRFDPYHRPPQRSEDVREGDEVGHGGPDTW